MKAKSATVIFIVDDQVVFNEKYKDVEVSFSVDYEIKEVYIPGSIPPVDLRYTGNNNVSLAIKTFEPEERK